METLHPTLPVSVADDGSFVRGMRGKILTPRVGASGHLRVWSRGRYHSVHVLVLETFYGPRPEGYVARHLDGNPGNNHPGNLAWGTFSENNHDSVRHGTHRNARKTHCVQGHELTPDNLYKSKRNRRDCRQCQLDRVRERKGR